MSGGTITLRKGPLPMRPAALTADQRVLYLALRREAVAPTVRLRVWVLGVLLALACALGVVGGWCAAVSRHSASLW